MTLVLGVNGVLLRPSGVPVEGVVSPSRSVTLRPPALRTDSVYVVPPTIPPGVTIAEFRRGLPRHRGWFRRALRFA